MFDVSGVLMARSVDAYLACIADGLLGAGELPKLRQAAQQTLASALQGLICFNQAASQICRLLPHVPEPQQARSNLIRIGPAFSKE